MRFEWKCVFVIQGEWVSVMEFDEGEVLKFCGKMLWVEKTSEKFEFSYLEKFSHSKKLDGMENLEKLMLNPIFSQKSQVKLSLLGSSHSLQKINGANEAQRV